MRNLDNEPNSKIPYDSDTIIRQSNYKKSRGSGKKVEFGSPSKALALLIVVLLIFNVVLGIVVFSKRGGGSTTNNNTYNISSDGLDVSAVTMRALPSVVLVNSGLNGMSASSLNYDNFSNMAERGSGIIFDDDKKEGTAYIVTCNHVIRAHSDEIFILLNDSYKPLRATRIYSTVKYDLAVIKIENQDEYKKSNATACQVAESNYVALGEDVVAIGNPQGRGFSVTDGVVSVTSELIKVDDDPLYRHRVMRISAPINAGNSGGGLFNAKGELLGIVSVKSQDTSSTSVDCIAYAIPSTLAINIAFNIVRNEIPSRADFGLTLSYAEGSDGSTGVEQTTLEDGKTITLRQIVVSGNTGASGLEVGDVIVGFSFSSYSVRMVNLYTLEDYSFAMSMGTRVTFEIRRSGRPMQVVAEVSSMVRADS